MSKIFNKISKMVLRINVELVQQMWDYRFLHNLCPHRQTFRLQRLHSLLLMNLRPPCIGLPIEQVSHAVTKKLSGAFIDASLALRRHGSWRRDLNVELINPFTRNIAHSWSKVFESDLFASFRASTVDVINTLIKEVEETAASGLKDRAKLQGEACIEEARVALAKAVELVKDAMNREQKETSRIMAPHVQAQLIDGYDTAMEERGTGSVARQKVGRSRYHHITR